MFLNSQMLQSAKLEKRLFYLPVKDNQHILLRWLVLLLVKE